MRSMTTRRNLLRLGLTVPLAALAAGCAQPERRLNFLARQGLALATLQPGPDGYFNICFLGDSIAGGADSSDGNGFRGHVMRWLYVNNETHNIRCVGNRGPTGTGPAGPLVHQGTGGFTTVQLLNEVRGGVLNYQQGRPAITVLMAGANDMPAKLPDDVMYARMHDLVVAVLDYSQVVIVCEQMPESSYNNHDLTDNTRRQQALNDRLPGLVADFPSRVAIAHTGPPNTSQADINAYGVHPTDAGYRRAGAQIYYALAPYFGTAGHMVPIDAMR